MMRYVSMRPALAVLTMALAIGLAQTPAFAADKKAKKKAPAQSTQPRKSAKFIPGSQETAKERSARLKRECKGGVNAGACAGYTE